MISCEQHDYVEIVCMYRYPICLRLVTGERVECKALDTARNEQKEECIKVEFEGAEQLIVLDKISVLEVLVDNPHFQKISLR